MLNLIRDSIHYDEYKKIVEAGMSKICLLFTEMILLNGSHSGTKDKDKALLSWYFYDCLRTVPIERCNNQHLWTCGHKQCKSQQNCIHNPVALSHKPINDIHVQDMKRDQDSAWDMKAHSFHIVLQQQLQPYEELIKEESFRRPQPGLAHLMRPQRPPFPLIPMVDVFQEHDPNPYQHQDPDDDEQEEEDYHRDEQERKERIDTTNCNQCTVFMVSSTV